jgi:hypothetical protein
MSDVMISLAPNQARSTPGINPHNAPPSSPAPTIAGTITQPGAPGMTKRANPVAKIAPQ